MKAIRIHEDGGPDVLRYEDAPDPEPGPGDVLVELRAASLNHLDLWVRQGRPSVPKPRILGADGAGLADGQRVLINPGVEHGDKITVIGEHTDGTHAELIAVPSSNVYPIPDGLSFEEAAAFPLVHETAYRMLVTRAGLREDEWVLVWGIGGGVATAANSIARALGARTIVTSSSDEKLAEVEADAKVNHAAQDVVAAVKEATGGYGADIVVEHVGDATWQQSLQAARQGGRVVVCGAPPGRTRRRHCIESGGSSCRSSAPRWERERTSRRSTSWSRPAGSSRSWTRSSASQRRGGPRAHGKRRAARQDHPPDPGIA